MLEARLVSRRAWGAVGCSYGDLDQSVAEFGRHCCRKKRLSQKSADEKFRQPFTSQNAKIQRPPNLWLANKIICHSVVTYSLLHMVTTSDLHRHTDTMTSIVSLSHTTTIIMQVMSIFKRVSIVTRYYPIWQTVPDVNCSLSKTIFS